MTWVSILACATILMWVSGVGVRQTPLWWKSSTRICIRDGRRNARLISKQLTKDCQSTAWPTKTKITKCSWRREDEECLAGEVLGPNLRHNLGFGATARLDPNRLFLWDS